MSYSIAMLSVHTSPLAMPGYTRDAGGMNVYIQQLARELGQSQINVDIFTRRTNETTPQIVHLSPRVRVIHIAAGPSIPIHKDELYNHLPAFAQHIDEFRISTGKRYDVLHSHYWLSGVTGMQLAQRWHVPHIMMFHTLAHLKQLANPDAQEPLLRLEMERRLIKQADRIIASTAEERAQIIRHCGATTGQTLVIPCGVDLQRFIPYDRKKAREGLGWKQDWRVLLFAGRLDPFKGPDMLLRTVAMMKEKAQVIIVGGKQTDDEEIQQLGQLAADLHISKRVHFLGARPQPEMPMLYSAADVTVIPSYHESFGLAAVESLACGTPVVATRAGGLNTIIRHGETGYLVPRCPGFFAERLDTLLQQPDLLEKMSQAARPSALRYSWKHVARLVREVYDDVLAGERILAAL
ncbi:MAG TPA: glycosyltransferase [Ktedonobacteraceae bacterium]|nr:glycosyltransferase [Ktedonobacteraceae bacterium]